MVEENRKENEMGKQIYLLQNTDGKYRPIIQDGDGNVEAVGSWVKQKQTAMNKIKKIEEQGKASFGEEILQQSAEPEQAKLFEVDEVDYLTTKNGYAFDEVASALQKEIRRGNEEMAYFWAKELESRYYKYLWKRLTIIASEDIGTANDQAVVFINALRNNYFFLRDNTKKELEVDYNMVAHAVLYLCRSPKSRENDNFLWVMEHDYRGDFGMIEKNLPEIPDYALDKHTQRGRGKGRKWEHFVKEATKVNNEDTDVNKYAEHMDRMLASRLRCQAEGKGRGFTREEWANTSDEEKEKWLNNNEL
jgi:replication-associated recombination protein RarA